MAINIHDIPDAPEDIVIDNFSVMVHDLSAPDAESTVMLMLRKLSTYLLPKIPANTLAPSTFGGFQQGVNIGGIPLIDAFLALINVPDYTMILKDADVEENATVYIPENISCVIFDLTTPRINVNLVLADNPILGFISISFGGLIDSGQDLIVNKLTITSPTVPIRETIPTGEIVSGDFLMYNKKNGYYYAN